MTTQQQRICRAESRRADILDYIAAFIRLRQYPPTNRDMAEHIGTSTSVVAYHLAIMKRERLIAIVPHIARGITLTEEA